MITTCLLVAFALVCIGAAVWFFLLDSRRATPAPRQTPGRHRIRETALGTLAQIDSQQYLTLPIRFGAVPTVWTAGEPVQVWTVTDLEKLEEAKS